MTKRIFEETEPDFNPTLKPKQEFSAEAFEVFEDTETEEVEEADLSFEEVVRPNRFWIRVLLSALVLFCVAVIAQSVQWLWDSYQSHAWIALAFGIVFFLLSLTGVGVIIREWRRLVYLRRYQQQQAMSEQILLESLSSTSGENAQTFCKNVLENMRHLPQIAQAEQRWQSQLNEAYDAKEVLYLFSENVLTPLDKQVKKLISRNATENALLVAVSPLAMVDVLLIAWRNFALVNKITKIYGMELGYISRLKLFKLVLTNMVFAGASEIASDVAADFLSQNMLAKLSLRATQGIGVGVLTARLGVKAMTFCRPIAFQENEKPKISTIRAQLLTSVKEMVFSKNREQAEEIVR